MTEHRGTWDFATVLESLAQAFPDHEAQACDARRFTWREFDRRAGGLASTMLEAGLVHQDKVAQYLYNGPEYLESVFASFKSGLVPVNSNYRYTDDELWYLWDNADVAAVVFDDELTERCRRLRRRLPEIRLWLHVGERAGCPDWAVPYETARVEPAGRCDAGGGPVRP